MGRGIIGVIHSSLKGALKKISMGAKQSSIPRGCACQVWYGLLNQFRGFRMDIHTHIYSTLSVNHVYCYTYKYLLTNFRTSTYFCLSICKCIYGTYRQLFLKLWLDQIRTHRMAPKLNAFGQFIGVKLNQTTSVVH